MPEFYDPYSHATPKYPEGYFTKLPKKTVDSGEYSSGHKTFRERPESFPHDHKFILKTLSKLALETNEYVVIGGANLVLRGVKPITEDIDLLVSEEGFDTLGYRKDSHISQPPLDAVENGATNETIHVYPRALMPVSAFTYLNGNGYYPMTFESAAASMQIVDGVPLASVEEVVASKQALGRRKDVRDLKSIARTYGIPLHIPGLPIEDDIAY